MGVLRMRALRPVSYGIVLIAPGLIAACANSTTSLAVNSGKYYAVSAARAAFYRYGPQQGNGPDQKLPHDTLVTLIQPTFGYCKVQLMSGEQGYVASEDIHRASAQLFCAATTKPCVTPTNLCARSLLNANDPR